MRRYTRELNIDTLKLRNRLPQNVTDETSAREVAKDIVCFDIQAFREYDEQVQSGIKYMLVAGLLALAESKDKKERTLSNLFKQVRKNRDLSRTPMAEPYNEMLDLLPEDTVKLARFHICDKLMKYQAFDQESES